MSQLSMSHHLLDEEAVYFPHCVDFRGRLYPMVAELSPQGDDRAKALLEFAEGKPLGEAGAFWLAVHIANLFGIDKCSFEDRAKWTWEHTPHIIESALCPLDERFWTTADDPWCALAACIEWAGYRMEGPDYVSHLPIAMDGSCSGLQHFSAMLLDEQGAKAVNLLPLPEPADIYTDVANLTAKLAAESGDPRANAWEGNITRKIVKRPCMTFAYSVTSRGMTDQIIDEMRKQANNGDYLPGVRNWDAAQFLAPLVEQAIRETVDRAAEAMDWLKACASLVAKEDMPINWYAPDGFPVQQRYVRTNGKRFNVWYKGVRMKVQLRVETSKSDARKHASAVAPNFVHSMDACHLRMVVNRMVDEGVTTSFAMVHDSFGVHACDIDELNFVIRDEFIHLYNDNRLVGFLRDQRQQHPELDFPAVPRSGELDLEEVRDADFFFS